MSLIPSQAEAEKMLATCTDELRVVRQALKVLAEHPGVDGKKFGLATTDELKQSADQMEDEIVVLKGIIGARKKRSKKDPESPGTTDPETQPEGSPEGSPEEPPE